MGHFQDAGLYEARSVVDIPVVALGEASMLYACQLGQRSGIVTINPRYISWFRHQIGKYGALAAEVVRLFAEQARPLVAAGCDVLIPGGGIPMLLFASLSGHVVDGAPVINGIPIVVKMAELAVKLKRLNGLGVSRVSDFIKPPPEIVDEFMANPKGL
jgi:allantoin racemase